MMLCDAACPARTSYAKSCYMWRVYFCTQYGNKGRSQGPRSHRFTLLFAIVSYSRPCAKEKQYLFMYVLESTRFGITCFMPSEICMQHAYVSVNFLWIIYSYRVLCYFKMYIMNKVFHSLPGQFLKYCSICKKKNRINSQDLMRCVLINFFFLFILLPFSNSGEGIIISYRRNVTMTYDGL